MTYSVTQLDDGFSITADGKTETFTEVGRHASLFRKDEKLHFGGRGFSRLTELGLFDPGPRGKGAPPSVDSILAGATAPPVAASVSLPPPKAAAPVVPMSPALAQAIVVEANRKMAAAKLVASWGAAAASMNEPDPPEVVAARVNGQRPSVGHEAVLEAHGWHNIIESINAETRSRREK